MRIAHLSDLHILDLNGVGAGRFVNRRLAGGLNLLLRRAAAHKIEILEKLIEDLLREAPDHIVISGDLSNLALESEFERVYHLLKLLGDGTKLSLVPGNHDYYTAGAARSRRFERYFHEFMFHRYSDLDPDPYPWVKDLGELSLVGVRTACETVPPLAYGQVDDRQFSRLRDVLAALPSTRPKAVLLHHALHSRGARRDLTDRLLGRDKLLALLMEQHVSIAFYGHDHLGRYEELEENGHHLHLLCCGSSTRFSDDPTEMAKYRMVYLQDGAIAGIETKVYHPKERRFFRTN